MTMTFTVKIALSRQDPDERLDELLERIITKMQYDFYGVDHVTIEKAEYGDTTGQDEKGGV